MEKIYDKKILFISPHFFNYEKQIFQALETEGAIVTYFNERPSDKDLDKILFRIFKKITRKKIEDYYQDLLDKVDKELFDYIFIIKPENMPKSFIEKLKLKNPHVKTILFMYDSIKNYKSISNKINGFDFRYSFDREDCITYNMKFRPLFFAKDYENLRGTIIDFKYDYSFIGTLHSDRMIILKKIEKEFEALGHSNKFYYLYIPMELIFYVRKIFNSEYKSLKLKDVKFRPFAFKSVLEIIKNSKIIIDIQHPKQTGLTMRTIEMLGAGRKLITTNTDIKNYDFYDPDNILIIDREQPLVSELFVNSPYKSVSNDVLDKYSISGFIKEIFKEV